MKKEKPTHVNVILRPKAGDIAIEGVWNADGTASSDGKFSVDDAKGIYAYMVLKGKELKKKLHTWSPKEGAGSVPVIKFNKYDNAPYVALVSNAEASRQPSAVKIVL
jgi:hypothetical protein